MSPKPTSPSPSASAAASFSAVVNLRHLLFALVGFGLRAVPGMYVGLWLFPRASRRLLPSLTQTVVGVAALWLLGFLVFVALTALVHQSSRVTGWIRLLLREGCLYCGVDLEVVQEDPSLLGICPGCGHRFLASPPAQQSKTNGQS